MSKLSCWVYTWIKHQYQQFGLPWKVCKCTLQRLNIAREKPFGFKCLQRAAIQLTVLTHLGNYFYLTIWEIDSCRYQSRVFFLDEKPTDTVVRDWIIQSRVVKLYGPNQSRQMPEFLKISTRSFINIFFSSQ